MSFMKTILSALIRGAEPWLPARQLLIIEGDMLPAKNTAADSHFNERWR